MLAGDFDAGSCSCCVLGSCHCVLKEQGRAGYKGCSAGRSKEAVTMQVSGELLIICL